MTKAQEKFVSDLSDLIERLDAAAEELDGTEGLAAGGERAVVIARTGLELAIEVEKELSL